MPDAPPRLQARYFDGVHARAHAVVLWVDGGVLHLQGDMVQHTVALHQVQWPERTRQAQRTAHFSDGGSVQCTDAAAWDAWARQSGLREPLVVCLQQSWRGVLASAVLLVAALLALQQWGLPLAARTVAHALPTHVDEALGQATLRAVDEQLMKPEPSAIPPAEQERIRTAFRQALGKLPAGEVPPWELVFRASRIGPNALALPGGTIVMTDEMVQLVDSNTDVLTAVLAHEMGHLQHRHGMRMLVQVMLLGTVSSVLLGDFSTVLAGGAALVGQSHYSRQAEREADAAAVRILRAGDISPAAMVTLFDKLAEKRRASKAPGQPDEKNGKDGKDGNDEKAHWLGLTFASHPADAERVRFFQEAAKGR